MNMKHATLRPLRRLLLGLALMMGAQISANPIETNTIKYQMANDYAECEISVDAPVDTESDIAWNLNNFIHEHLQTVKLGVSDNVASPITQAVVDLCGKKRVAEIMADVKETYGGEKPNAPHMYKLEIRKEFDNDNLVTYTATIFTYDGGAHGMTQSASVTYSKNLVMRLSYDNAFSPEGLKALKRALREGLKKYFEVTTDQELIGMLNGVDNPYDLPLPGGDPFITQQGLVLRYAPYEIAPYSAGMPTVTIPWTKIRSLLRPIVADKFVPAEQAAK